MYVYNFYYLFLQVWDRRQLFENCLCLVGVLVGYVDGIIYIDLRVCYILFEVFKYRIWFVLCV